MSLSVSGFYKNIKESFQKTGSKKRILFISVAGAIVVVAILLVLLLGKNSYAVLYRGLSAAEGAEVIGILDELGKTYKIDVDGTIYVPAEEEALIKMQLASEGYPKSTLTYDIFTSSSAIITTDYEKRQYLIFQLQNRLQDAIKTLDGIQNAIVTLNVADDTSFVLKNEKNVSSASVVLDIVPGKKLSEKQVRGIESLVGRSVSGLDTSNVVIIDGSGDILNEAKDEEGIDGTSTKLELVENINRLYENKIISLLEPVVGDNGVSVVVNVVVDFRKKTSEEVMYSPVVGENGIPYHHEYDHSSTNGGTIPGGVPGTETNSGTPTYQEEEEDPDDGDKSANFSGSTDYYVNKMIETIIDNGGTISDMTVAVLLDVAEMPENVKEQYQKLVAFGAGVPMDKVAISNAAFLKEGTTPDPILPTPDPWSLAEWLGIDEKLLILIGIGAALVLLVVIWILAAISAKRKRKLRAKLAEEAAKQAEQQQNLPGGIVLNETREQVLKKQIKEFTSTNPEIVAQLLRAWMKEGETR
ncbi:MAG TPA: flagellar M-ring protein FliF [Clostridiales bacterium]|jgi:flagellar M-ring protein FliF|nr:flagellar M-ring protein FliF [Clostridiales bacterium]